MKTVAVYKENKIKTYGFKETTDLSLFELSFKPESTVRWGSKLHGLGVLGRVIRLVLIHGFRDQDPCLYLLVENRHADLVLTELQSMIQPYAGDTVSITSPVEMINFYGPHFGDRSGIADAAFRALECMRIQTVLTACSGASLYLVFQRGKAREARKLLENAFVIPRRRARGKRKP